MNTKKLIEFGTERLVKQIQEHANKHFNGNFTKAVLDLTTKSLKDNQQ